MIEVQKDSNPYLAQFERVEKEAREHGPSWLAPVRKAAISRFIEMGFPTVRDEEWRFTNVAPIVNTLFAPAGAARAEVDRKATAPFRFDTAAAELVVVNGRYAPELSTLGSLPRGVTVESLATALRERADLLQPHLSRYADYHQHAFTALNTAMIEDGLFVHVPRGTVVEGAIHLLFVSTGGDQPIVTHPRTLILADANSQVTVVESYVSIRDTQYFTNAVTELVAGDNAVVDHVKVERESEQAFHIATLHLQMHRNSNVSSHAVLLGGALVRNDICAMLDGEGCTCTLNGLYMIGGTQLVDNHLRIEHIKPHCDSREFFKGILTGSAKGIFSGRIVVHKDAQKTDAKQTNMSLLLSEEARVESRPQLEILANDVKCTHGATVGQISDEAIFYLRSRGIDKSAARSLLVFTFANESLERIRIQPLRTKLKQLLLERLPQGRLLQDAI
ncbi:MAG: Fe-S cluster assembly protein SufD [Planctomycetes bacterium]|nr:Fe-S cluster assembly protein SufD [Planctomycetota bacterium]